MIGRSLITLAKGSFVYGVGATLQRFIGLLLLPFLTSALEPKDYGVVALIALIGIAMNGVLTLGTNNSMGLLYFKEKCLEERRVVVSTTVVLMVISSFFWYVMLWISAPFLSKFMFQTENYADLIRVSFLGSVFQTISEPWLAFLRMEKQAKKYVFITIFSAIVTSILTIFLVIVLNWSTFGLILAATIGSVVMFLVTWIFVGKYVGYRININIFRPLIRIGFPSIFGIFAFLTIDYIDRQMIERFLGLDHLGVYLIGYSFGMVMLVATNGFSQAWPPFFMSFINKQSEAERLFGRVLNYYVLLFGLLIIIFFFSARPIVSFMTANSYSEAWIVVGVVSAAYALKGCYLIILPGIYFNSKLKWQSFIEWIAAIINILLNIYLIPRYGIFGAASATLLSYSTLPILSWLVARNYLNVKYDWGKLISAISLVILFSAALFYQALYFSLYNFYSAACGLIIIVLYIIFSYKLLLNSSDRNFINGLMYK